MMRLPTLLLGLLFILATSGGLPCVVDAQAQAHGGPTAAPAGPEKASPCGDRGHCTLNVQQAVAGGSDTAPAAQPASITGPVVETVIAQTDFPAPWTARPAATDGHRTYLMTRRLRL